MFSIYKILSSFAALFFTFFSFFIHFSSKEKEEEYKERLGIYPDEIINRIKKNDGKNFLIHGASVGEIKMLKPLITELKKRFPSSKIILSAMTKTGWNTAKKYINDIDAPIVFPFDSPPFIKRLLNSFKPSLILIAETEIWPVLINEAHKNNIPIILINGRISNKSFKRYMLLRMLFIPCIKKISLFLMQSKADAKKIKTLGAKPENVIVTGNMKFDLNVANISKDEKEKIFKSLNLSLSSFVIVAGSTHNKEEEIFVKLFPKWKKIFKNLVLIIAPRHLERLVEVEKILEKNGIKWTRKTEIQKSFVPEIIIIDTLGELTTFYSIATVVFVGGSLVPIGGHNILEPMAYGVPVIFGPYMENFYDIANLTLKKRGGIQVDNEDSLFVNIKDILSNPKKRKLIGEAGLNIVKENRGATLKTVESILPFLKKPLEKIKN